MGSCRYGSSCSFSHNLEPSVDGGCQQIPCPFFLKGTCRYGDACRLSHSFSTTSNPKMVTQQQEQEETITCGICLEKPTKFGLLNNCDHVFCFSCLMEWRRQKASSNTRACPTCRNHSDYVIPSSKYATHDNGKDLIIMEYKRKCSYIPCRHFKGLGSCPFGRDCFYRHLDEEGRDIKHLDKTMKELKADRRRRRSNEFGIPQDDIDELLESFLIMLHYYRSVDETDDSEDDSDY